MILKHIHPLKQKCDQCKGISAMKQATLTIIPDDKTFFPEKNIEL